MAAETHVCLCEKHVCLCEKLRQRYNKLTKKVTEELELVLDPEVLGFGTTFFFAGYAGTAFIWNKLLKGACNIKYIDAETGVSIYKDMRISPLGAGMVGAAIYYTVAKTKITMEKIRKKKDGYNSLFGIAAGIVAVEGIVRFVKNFQDS